MDSQKLFNQIVVTLRVKIFWTIQKDAIRARRHERQGVRAAIKQTWQIV